MFAIRNKRTKEWVYGTNFRYTPYRQRLSNEQAMTYPEKIWAEYDMKSRQMSEETYEIVEVELRPKESK